MCFGTRAGMNIKLHLLCECACIDVSLRAGDEAALTL